MTARQAERIMGLEVIQERSSRLLIFIAIESDGNRVAAARTEKLLVETVYALRRAEVFKEQDYLCKLCGGLKPLECDHIESRGAHGRNDRKENLRGLCVDCHRIRHGAKMGATR